MRGASAQVNFESYSGTIPTAIGTLFALTNLCALGAARGRPTSQHVYAVANERIVTDNCLLLVDPELRPATTNARYPRRVVQATPLSGTFPSEIGLLTRLETLYAHPRQPARLRDHPIFG